MKKLMLLFTCTLLFTSCSIDDDEPSIVMVPAEVVATDLPEFFEDGEVYTVKVTYLLPDACHVPAGLHVTRGSSFGNGRRDIFVNGVASHEIGTECEEEGEEEDLEQKASFQIRIDEDEPYTFYLWTGIDENDKNIYTEVVIPVGAPETDNQE